MIPSKMEAWKATKQREFSLINLSKQELLRVLEKRISHCINSGCYHTSVDIGIYHIAAVQEIIEELKELGYSLTMDSENHYLYISWS